MRRLIVSGVAAVCMAITNVAVADSVGAQVDPSAAPTSVSRPLPGSFIDNIEVPYDVLDYVHMTYQGHAVIHAHKLRRRGQEVYRLQIAPDEKSPTSIYLFYDMKWQLLGNETTATSPRRQIEQPQEVEVQPEPVVQQEAPDEDRGSGRGGEEGEVEEPEPQEPPEPPVEEPEPPVNSGPGNGNGPGRSN